MAKGAHRDCPESGRNKEVALALEFRRGTESVVSVKPPSPYLDIPTRKPQQKSGGCAKFAPVRNPRMGGIGGVLMEKPRIIG